MASNIADQFSSGSAPVKPEWVRLPAPTTRCRFTGLSRSTICELVNPCEANGYNPPVKSVVLKKRGAIRGIRLVHLDSLLTYLGSLGD